MPLGVSLPPSPHPQNSVPAAKMRTADEVGEIIAEERIEHAFSERFQQLLNIHTPCQVGFEATMNWGWLHEILEEIAGVERIVLANPLHVRLIAAAQVKTDKVKRVQGHVSTFDKSNLLSPGRGRPYGAMFGDFL